MPTLRLSPLASSTTGSPSCNFTPLYNGLPVHTARDPYGLLPWLCRICHERQLILQWNNEHKELELWYWPVLNNARVPPSELNTLRNTHVFTGPCCLCASQSPNPTMVTEVAIFLVTMGRLAGEYVAVCALGHCKYWIFLEWLYTRRGLPICTVTERAVGSVLPLSIEYNPEETEERTESEVPSNSQGSLSSSSGNVSTPTPVSPPLTQAPKRSQTMTGRGAETCVIRRRTTANVPDSDVDDPEADFIIPSASYRPRSPINSPFALLLALDYSEDMLESRKHNSEVSSPSVGAAKES